MELKVNIEYQELLALIRQLPSHQLMLLKRDLQRTPVEVSTPSEQSGFQQMLVDGPMMDDEQFQYFESNRAHFNLWRHQ